MKTQIEDLIAMYMDYAHTYYSTRHPGNLRSGLRRFFGSELSSPIGELRSPTIARLRDEHARAGKLSRTTINKYLGYVSQLLSWAAEYGHADAGVVAQISVVRKLSRGRHGVRETKAVSSIDPELVELTRAHLPPQLRDYVDMLRLTGMRPGEARSMRFAELELVATRAYVYSPTQHKNAHRGKPRYIAIVGEAFDLTNRIIGELRQHGLYQDDEYLFSPEGDGRRPYAECSIGQAIRRVCEEQGLDHWSPNQLRHLYATERRGRGHSLDDIAKILGHSSTRTTQIYAHEQRERVVETARLLAG